MNNLRRLSGTLLSDESGQDLVEYGLIAGLLGLGTIAAISRFSTSLATALSNIGATLTNST